MLGITFTSDGQDQYLDLNIDPNQLKDKIDVNKVHKLILESDYKNFFIFDENIIDALNTYKIAVKKENTSVIVHRVGERRDTQVKCKIVEDQLSAALTITKGFGDAPLAIEALNRSLDISGVKRGISKKRLLSLVEKSAKAKSGDVIEELVAKGLPPRTGKSSYLKPLVNNALERILKPQAEGKTRVDMRNLGTIICIQKGAKLLRRMPPTKGRNGYSVGGEVIKAKPGEWIKFRPGEGTVISDGDENLLVADISGMPKFKDQKMWVDNVFTCTGVNVGSGNVDYNGSVIVNGDVTEKMVIKASGDVTVNGFVESATIQAEGDIIITEGAMGKVNDKATEYSTSLTAKGSVHVQHGQGLDIKCKGNVSVGRQLAYSRIDCRGQVTVGAVDKPNGNLFACVIKCQNSVTAGTLGAVSGSSLSVDFSEGFNTLLERKDTLDELLKQVKQNNFRHLERMNIINSKFVPDEMQKRVDEANQLFQGETQLLQWLEAKAKEMQQSKEKYQNDIQLVANKRVYPGVVVKLNNRTWRAEREYDRSNISFHGHQWHFEPLI